MGAAGSAEPREEQAPAPAEEPAPAAAPQQEAPAEEAPAPEAAPAPEEAPAPALDLPDVEASDETYTVESGDTLFQIAESLDLDSGWLGLYAVNQDSVSDTDLIYAGQELVLPAE
ncbi:LysM peptidoglycan-binding domain-containing protein [Microbacterium sp. gxy059]